MLLNKIPMGRGKRRPQTDGRKTALKTRRRYVDGNSTLIL